MATPRNLSKPPVQEAIMHFGFPGVQLPREALEHLAAPYVDQGWDRQEIHTYQATLGNEVPHAPISVVSSDSSFAGFVLRNPVTNHFVRAQTDHLAVSVTSGYRGWEDLEAHAQRAFNAYLDIARPAAVNRIATRFINRVPPYADFTSFDQILTRPPLPLEELPGSRVTEFLRRHVIEDLDGGFTANLTIGTVDSDPEEPQRPARAIVIDVDVFKDCYVQPIFDAVRAEITKAREIKNQLFFGCLQEPVVEKFA